MAFIPKSSTKRHWCIGLLTVVIIAVVIAIVAPLAVILPQKGRDASESSILLPLYIYPETNTTWTPLFSAIESRPQLKFIVIVNPSSGPGSDPYPNDQYTTALEKLNAYRNVQTVGYVRTNYANRSISTVVAEVSTYAGWAANSSALAMHGIFFDEAPHQYVPESVEYMHTVNQAVRDATGLQGDKIIIHNPGVIPDARYNDSNTNITVVFEQSLPVYTSLVDSLSSLPGDRSQYSYMINSVPSTSRGDMKKFVQQISKHAEYLFVTDNTEDFYESFGTGWANFAESVPT
ncbi:Spherulation-specific family 4 [Leptodontidium sp. 2 PMI_412]|nr:Spherulation-specific family 4 [Leptodontidium sp. MPI-SDFR-AT-0119]KAH9206431.1 Spherulation-specific family 4 [Leptodontidium sp. 2 PMI_412]